MAKYLEDFIERNSDKPFVANFKKYADLTEEGRKKVISSFLTHLFIDAEKGVDNLDYQKEVVAILNEFVYFGVDDFLSWMESKIN